MKRWGYRIHLEVFRYLWAFLYKTKGGGFSVSNGHVFIWPWESLEQAARRARYKAVQSFRMKLRHQRLVRHLEG